MKKAFVTAVLLLGFLVLCFGTNGSNAFVGPKVIARVNLKNQTSTIPTTTVFTPTQSGLYRASAYMTMTTPGSGTGTWDVEFNWTDDSGPESSNLASIVESETPSQDYCSPFPPSCNLVFRAVAGTPVTYYVNGNGA